jgi:hypothetical protein
MNMMDNCKYNKVKVLHDLSALCWFIEKHALDDAKKIKDDACLKKLQELSKDLEKHLVAFKCPCKCAECTCH